MKFLPLLICLLASLLFVQCSGDKKKAPVQSENEALIRANKQLVKNESAQIDAFIERRGWTMSKTGTGLRYMIYKQGSGAAAKNGHVATIHYTISLLDGTEAYTSRSGEPKQFRIGQDDVESGLHEGILLMKVGDKARFILPPHLAHGLTGDLDKIPAMSTIIYDVELIALQ